MNNTYTTITSTSLHNAYEETMERITDFSSFDSFDQTIEKIKELIEYISDRTIQHDYKINSNNQIPYSQVINYLKDYEQIARDLYYELSNFSNDIGWLADEMYDNMVYAKDLASSLEHEHVKKLHKIVIKYYFDDTKSLVENREYWLDDYNNLPNKLHALKELYGNRIIDYYVTE
jgi:hypothetical protein